VIRLGSQHKVLSAVSTTEAKEHVVVEWSLLRQVAECCRSLHRPCIDLFDVAVGHSLPDFPDRAKELAWRPEAHILVQIFAA